MTAAAEQVAGGAQLRRVDIGLREHPAPEQDRNLVGGNLVVLGLAPVNGFPIEGVAQDKGDAFLRAEIRQPLPGEHTFDPDDEIVAVWGADAQKGVGRGRQILMDQLCAVLIENTDIHRSGM